MEYRFDRFRVDPRSNSLYFDNRLVDGLSRKSVQILVVLLERPRQVVSHEEIISRVWGDNFSGAGSQSIAQYIGKLRKVLSEIHPGENFISTAPNRGYIFGRDVVVGPAPNGISDVKAAEAPVVDTAELPNVGNVPTTRSSSRRRLLLVPVVALALIAIGYGAAGYFSAPEEKRVRQVVRDSQLYESLVLYRDPKSFSEENLDKYWTTELDPSSNFDRKRIRTAVRNLLDKGLHYGNETKCEQFEFQTVEIDARNDMALVRTLEKWFIAVYREDGTLEKNKYVGPYFVSYVLRNIDGRWLIEKSNTARANLPMPRISAVLPQTEVRAGQQFFVTLSGEEFLPQSVYLRVVGEGCPEQSPCIVPNSALMKHSKLTETTLEGVPLTLARGDFSIYVHNSENHVSNSVSLKVP